MFRNEIIFRYVSLIGSLVLYTLCSCRQAVRSEVFAVRGPPAAARDGDARLLAGIPPALLHLRRLLPAATEGRAVRPARQTAVLQTGLREGDVPLAAGQPDR